MRSTLRAYRQKGPVPFFSWMPATHYAARGAALYPLYKLKVIWHRTRNDELEIRLDPEFSHD